MFPQKYEERKTRLKDCIGSRDLIVLVCSMTAPANRNTEYPLMKKTTIYVKGTLS